MVFIMSNVSNDSNGSRPSQPQKKILENPFVGSLVVPIAIVLAGALIIFGITKMLSSERSYRDLVEEIQSKTFGNKWVAAYELSKQINSSQIPEEDYPWLIENLTSAYKDSVDARTRGFIIAAIGALRTPLALPTFASSIKDIDPDVKFHTIVSLANLPKGFSFDWKEVINLLESEDSNLRQASIMALATHVVPEGNEGIRKLLNDPKLLVKYTAAIGLIAYKDETAKIYLEEILKLSYPAREEAKTEVRTRAPSFELDYKQISDLKLSVLITLEKNTWRVLNETILEVAQKDENKSIATKAKEVLNILKK